MQIIRTILWVLVTAVLVAFIAMNWSKVPVNIWPMDDGNYLHFEWPVGVIALVFFILGALPMWVVHRAGRWRLKRRIHSLENTVLASSAPVVTSHSETGLPDTSYTATPPAPAVLEEEPGLHPSPERPHI
jgi:uncharacterized integral membrane protein